MRKGKRDIQATHCAILRKKKELCTLIYYPGTKTGTDPATRKGPGRLVPNHPKSAGTRMPERFLPKIYTLKGSQGIAKRIFLHHPGTAPRIDATSRTSPPMWTRSSTRSSRQGRANDFIIAMCNLIQRLTIDLFAHHRRHLRSRARRPYHHGYALRLP